MDPDSASTHKIDKLNDSNYHAWKQKVEHLLVLKDLWDYIEEDPPSDQDDISSWTRADRKCRAIICLTLSDHIL